MRPNVVIVAGKGGVGKTTVTAVLARAAANLGRRVLALELDGKQALTAMIPDLEVQTIRPGPALEEYLLGNGFGRIAKRFIHSGVAEMVGTATPGLNDVVVLGKIKQLERSGDYDVIVVDGPAAGHAVTFLTSAAGLSDAARSGPVHQQARAVAELLTDPVRCQICLVTLPETTPVNEAVETAFHIEERAGVHLSTMFANQVDLQPPLPKPPPRLTGPAAAVAAAGAAAEFRTSRYQIERRELERLGAELPLPVVELPRVASAGVTAADIDTLADYLLSGRLDNSMTGEQRQ